ncbi:MAG TPA: hypothetical protein VIH18_21785 [Candidatus Binatia bacterium]|jgi:hypothetical protein
MEATTNNTVNLTTEINNIKARLTDDETTALLFTKIGSWLSLTVAAEWNTKAELQPRLPRFCTRHFTVGTREELSLPRRPTVGWDEGFTKFHDAPVPDLWMRDDPTDPGAKERDMGILTVAAVRKAKDGEQIVFNERQ